MFRDDIPNPFHYLAGEAGKVIADSWTVAMLGLWNAGLWLFRLVLRIADALTTPDLSATRRRSLSLPFTKVGPRRV